MTIRILKCWKDSNIWRRTLGKHATYYRFQSPMEQIIADVSGLRLTLTRQGASPTSWPGQRRSSPASSTSSRTSRRRTGTLSPGLCLILGPECVPVCGRAEKYLVTSQRDSSLIAQNISMTWPGKSNHKWKAQHTQCKCFISRVIIDNGAKSGGGVPSTMSFRLQMPVTI